MARRRPRPKMTLNIGQVNSDAESSELEQSFMEFMMGRQGLSSPSARSSVQFPFHSRSIPVPFPPRPPSTVQHPPSTSTIHHPPSSTHHYSILTDLH